MARPPKKGLDYFNIDCQLTDSIKYLLALHGPAGYGIYILLLKKCYETNGYYTEWTEKTLTIFARDIGADVENVRGVLKTCLQESIFSEKILNDFQVLTGQDIQERFIHIVTDSKRINKEIAPAYTLLPTSLRPAKPEFTPEETPPPVTITPEEMPQSKVNEIKEKDNTPAADAAGTASQEEDVKKIYRSLDEKIRENKSAMVRLIRQYRPQFLDPYVDLWNIFAKETGLSPVKKISDSRRRKFAVRIREEAFNFEEILRKAKGSSFLRLGKWFGLDWLLENDKNYLKVLEGNYEGNGQAPGAGSPAAKKSAPKGFTEELDYLIGRQREGELDPQFINPELYDFCTARGYIPIGVLQSFPGATDQERKRAGVLAYITQTAKPALV